MSDCCEQTSERANGRAIGPILGCSEPLCACRNMSLRLKFAEIQAASAEREAARLQNELDILLDDVDDWKAKYEEICEELEHTFYEMSEY